MAEDLKELLSKLKDDCAIQMDRTAREYGTAMGKAVQQRFEALEAIVLILAQNAPPEIQTQISREIQKRKASWLK